MSNPERLCLDGPTGVPEELVVTLYDEGMDERRSVAVPRPRDVAEALSRCSREWFVELLQDLGKRRASARGLELVAAWLPTAAALADVAGGDCDPGFGVSPEDSARLLELRQAIDALGWNTPEEEERGDYVARVHQLREEIAAADLVHARNLKLEKLNRAQRRELRRFNRERRAYNQGSEAQLSDTFRRWPQCRPTPEHLTELRAAFPQWASADDNTLRNQISKLGSALGLKPR